MKKQEYFAECIADSAQANGIELSVDQINLLAKDVETSVEHMSLAYPIPENPLRREVDELTFRLKEERSLEFCRECQGTGRLEYSMGSHVVNTDCHKCRGRGKKKP